MKPNPKLPSTHKKQPNLTQTLENPLQIILQSIQSKGINPKSFSDQISQFLTHLSGNEKVYMLPSTEKSQYLQIFNIRNSEAALRHRIGRKRQTKKNQANENNKQSDKDIKIMFVTDESLCLNCILLTLANKKCEKVSFSLGCRVEDWNRHEAYEQRSKQIVGESMKDIEIYENVEGFLKQKRGQQQGRNYRKKAGESDRSRNSIFGHLKQIKIEINNEAVTLQEWASSLKVGAQILKYIQRQSMNNLESLDVVMRDERKFANQIKTYPQLKDKVNQISNSIKRIIDAKNSADEELGYFPKLTRLAFNPIFYMMTHNNPTSNPPQVEQQDKNDQKQGTEQSSKQVPVTRLNLLGITQQVNSPEYLSQFLRIILSNFPKLTDLNFQMSPHIPFDLFNEFVASLYKYCCLLQSLHIVHNNDRIDKLPGLKCILQYYPYLSDLRIQISPRGDENMNRQFEIEWEFVKEIQFRRLHIQRMINMIKILQKKGYNKSQCMEIIEFMKPLKFPTING